jgi:hypothetical protein
MLKLESLSDLQSLIDDGIEEGLELEYKSSPSLTREYSTGEGRELNEAAIEMGDNPPSGLLNSDGCAARRSWLSAGDA